MEDPYPAYPSGKSWDEASGKMGLGEVLPQRHFGSRLLCCNCLSSDPLLHGRLEMDKIQQCSTRIPSPFLPSTQLERLQEVCTATTDWEAILCWIEWFTPSWQGAACAKYVLGDCVKVTSLAALAGGGKGEGSKSGQASLGGNSLLDCVVYGRVAGAACAKYVWSDSVKVTSLAALAGGGLVKPDDPDAKIKFLAAEAFRGVGGLVFDALGIFANDGQEGLRDRRDVEEQTSIPSRSEHGGF